MAARPSMHTKDASGKRVSLLNEEPDQPQRYQHSPSSSYSSTSNSSSYSNSNPNSNLNSNSNSSSSSSLYTYHASKKRRSMSSQSTPSSASASPTTPALMRADSYDSQNTASNDTLTPLTPISMTEFGGRRSSFMSVGALSSGYDERDRGEFGGYCDRMQSFDDFSDPSYTGMMASRRSSYADASGRVPAGVAYPPPRLGDAHADAHRHDRVSISAPERGPKRYSCRYRDSLGCEKTFTTSGHASRHSKIHTAEKAVPCTFKGCHKKFTRNDNMKQHLETHYKDRARSSRSSVATIKSSSSSSSSSKAPPHSQSYSDNNTAPTEAPALKKTRRGHPSRASLDVHGRTTEPLVISPSSSDVLVDPALLSPASPTLARYYYSEQQSVPAARRASTSTSTSTTPTAPMNKSTNLSNPLGLQLTLPSRPMAALEPLEKPLRSPRSPNAPPNVHAGLDVLAMAVDWRAHGQA